MFQIEQNFFIQAIFVVNAAVNIGNGHDFCAHASQMSQGEFSDIAETFYRHCRPAYVQAFQFDGNGRRLGHAVTGAAQLVRQTASFAGWMA